MLTPDEPRTIQVRVGAAVSGRVVKGDEPLAGARVRIAQTNRMSRNYLGADEIATDEHGRFLLTSLGANDEYEVSVITEDRVPRTLAKVVVKVGADDTKTDAGTIDLRPAATR